MGKERIQRFQVEVQMLGDATSQQDPAQQQTTKTKDGRKDFPEKVSFYLTTQQLEKLDDLVYNFGKRHKVRINRNQIVRHLIDLCNLDTLDTLDTSEE